MEAFTVQQEQAIMTLMNLQLAGFSEKKIAELTTLIRRWNKQWGGLVQGNGTRAFKLDDNTTPTISKKQACPI